MYATLATLVDRLAGTALSGTEVIRWGAPVPAFGDATAARVATLGLNPSNREFVDEDGRELNGSSRRFHTLNSLGLPDWLDADSRHLELVLQSCISYFRRNPYDRWFQKLDYILAGADSSYFAGSAAACHLDLIPYATKKKWTDLTSRQRDRLLETSGDALGTILRHSQISVLVLNGQSVVDRFEQMCGIVLEREVRNDWTLPRQSVEPVRGISYCGSVGAIAGSPIARSILVMGYNHNIQSSYGVTTGVLNAIREWLRRTVSEYRDEDA